MKAVILAGGEGVRMRPLTLDTPKPLLKVNNKPILEHIISRLPDEIDEIVLVVGYLGDQIKKYFGNNFLDRKIQYVNQDVRSGTFGSLKLCQSLLKNEKSFLVLYADDIHGKEGIKDCLKKENSIIVNQVEDPKKFGVVSLKEDGSLADIIEKPKDPSSKIVFVGVSHLNSDIFKYEPERRSNGEYYLTDAISMMVGGGHKFSVIKSDLWIPIGYPEDIEKAEKILSGF